MLKLELESFKKGYEASRNNNVFCQYFPSYNQKKSDFGSLTRKSERAISWRRYVWIIPRNKLKYVINYENYPRVVFAAYNYNINYTHTNRAFIIEIMIHGSGIHQAQARMNKWVRYNITAVRINRNVQTSLGSHKTPLYQKNMGIS